MKDKTWEVEFEGRQLRVTNRHSLFPPRTGEYLEVDGQLVATGSCSWLSEFSLIEVQLSFAGIERQVEVYIAPIKGKLFTMGCHILIDGTLIGGDTESTLVIPDLAQARASYLTNPRRFIRRLFTSHVISGSLMVALLLVDFTKLASIVDWLTAILIVAISSIALGSLTGWIEWRSLRDRLTSNKVNGAGA